MLGFTRITPPVDFDKGVVLREEKKAGTSGRLLEALTIALLVAMLAGGFLLRLWAYVLHGVLR